MSDTQKTSETGKRAKRSKDPKMSSLARLDRGPARDVQETFRCTVDEHNTLVERAQKEKFTSMSDFYRAKLELDPDPNN